MDKNIIIKNTVAKPIYTRKLLNFVDDCLCMCVCEKMQLGNQKETDCTQMLGQWLLMCIERFGSHINYHLRI